VPPVGSLYSDRSRSPLETVALVRPHFARLGITRLARQTSLDRVGIPCFAAIRPNSRSIATNQGKGIDDASALASAVMEATEYAIAESPRPSVRSAKPRELTAQGKLWWHPGRVLPFGHEFDEEAPISWLVGGRLVDGAQVMVPHEAASMSGEREELPGRCQSTNGLASGNTPAEAAFHALCELIERDAGTLWSFLDIDAKRRRCVDPARFDEPLVARLADRFAQADLELRLFDQTSDLGVPTYMAVSAPRGGPRARHFDIATGSGTHPDPARAALRAITEAAQSRITFISGARDDIAPGLYRVDGAEEASELLAARPTRGIDSCSLQWGAEALLSATIAKLRRGGVDDVVLVPLGGEDCGICVVRLLSNLLEDRGPNVNWRPGQRALGMLLEAA
jgi:ribosomal protein S12 methylthiotransferase accessory factor